MLKARASHKSFKPKDGPPSEPPAGRTTEVQWHGEKRTNDTHASTTDPQARLYRKSNNTAATLCYAGHLLMENRSALILDAELTIVDGYAERATAIEMLSRLPTMTRRRTVGADKAYDTKGFVADVRALGFTPHVASNTKRSAIDARTTRHTGHAISQRIRKRIEEPFGWTKTSGGGRQLRYRGRDRNRAWFKITGAVYNLIRINRTRPPSSHDLTGRHRRRRGDGWSGDHPKGIYPQTEPTQRPARARQPARPHTQLPLRQQFSAPC